MTMGSSYPEDSDFVSSHPKRSGYVIDVEQKRYAVLKWGNPICQGTLVDRKIDDMMVMEVSFVRFNECDVGMMDENAKLLKCNLGHPDLCAIYDVIKDPKESLYLLVIEKMECTLSTFFKQANGSIWQPSLADGDFILHPQFQKPLRGALEAFQSMVVSRFKVLNIDEDHIFLSKWDLKPKILYAVAEMATGQDPIVGDATWRDQISKHKRRARVDPYESLKNKEIRPKLRQMMRRLVDPDGSLQNDEFFNSLLSDSLFDPLDSIIIHPILMTPSERFLHPIIQDLGISSLKEQDGWEADERFNTLALPSTESWQSKIQNNGAAGAILDYSRQMEEKDPGFRGYDNSASSERKFARNFTTHCNDAMTLKMVKGKPQKLTPEDILLELRQLPCYLANGFIYARVYLREYYAKLFGGDDDR